MALLLIKRGGSFSLMENIRSPEASLRIQVPESSFSPQSPTISLYSCLALALTQLSLCYAGLKLSPSVARWKKIPLLNSHSTFLGPSSAVIITLYVVLEVTRNVFVSPAIDSLLSESYTCIFHLCIASSLSWTV